MLVINEVLEITTRRWKPKPGSYPVINKPCDCVAGHSVFCVTCFPKSLQRVGGGGGELGGPVEVINEPDNAPSKQQFDWTLLSEQFNSPPLPPDRRWLSVHMGRKERAHY